ncbi:hypothetical protein PanWU01x14_032990 [Parasponia andersonii]|uniref:Uncharacterized protein n=1 Tax=Parasponia andersonii TaxID=3476 RepID=A0A2P5DTJ1_PARAD|nr:hypothetical protein PanWU01x14_032990 [Parasponia andersonii]
MLVIKINKWVVLVGLFLFAIYPSVILSSNSQDSSDKKPSSYFPSQGGGDDGSSQNNGWSFRCGCRSSPDGSWGFNWVRGLGPDGSSISFGSGSGQSTYGGGFGFSWGSSTSNGDSNSPSQVVGGGGNDVSFRRGSVFGAVHGHNK